MSLSPHSFDSHHLVTRLKAQENDSLINVSIQVLFFFFFFHFSQFKLSTVKNDLHKIRLGWHKINPARPLNSFRGTRSSAGLPFDLCPDTEHHRSHWLEQTSSRNGHITKTTTDSSSARVGVRGFICSFRLVQLSPVKRTSVCLFQGEKVASAGGKITTPPSGGRTDGGLNLCILACNTSRKKRQNWMQ